MSGTSAGAYKGWRTRRRGAAPSVGVALAHNAALRRGPGPKKWTGKYVDAPNNPPAHKPLSKMSVNEIWRERSALESSDPKRAQALSAELKKRNARNERATTQRRERRVTDLEASYGFSIRRLEESIASIEKKLRRPDLNRAEKSRLQATLKSERSALSGASRRISDAKRYLR